MAELSLPWDGLLTGDAASAPYSAAVWGKIIGSTSRASAHADRCVVFHELQELEVTGATSPVAMASGRAVVDGTYYENDADAVIIIPTPSGAARIDRVVLQKDVVAQQVRVHRVAGSEGGAAPSLTQTPGVLWEAPIAEVTIQTNGSVAIVDERVFPEDIP